MPGEEDLIGAGIHFCATCDGPFYKGQELVVVGGENSGIEEGLFLTKFATKITILEFSDRLKASRLLQESAANNPKMEIQLQHAVQEFKGNGKLKAVVVKDLKTSEVAEMNLAGVFVFIGLQPDTDFIKDVVDLDAQGFVKTSATLETNIPGVFATGDVRAGSTKQIASAVGEGATAALMVRHYLEDSKSGRGYKGD